MAFKGAAFKSFFHLLNTASHHPDIEKRCISENFILEDRLTKEREHSYKEHLKYPINNNGWIVGHEEYLEQKIYVKILGTPETFTSINIPNLILDFDIDQYLVRLENVGRLTRLHGDTVDEMMSLFNKFIKDHNDSENMRIIEDIFSKWNKKRDHRPVFAGFWGDVKDIFTDAADNRIEDEDWANRLRDRLGVGHMDPINNEPIPVLMFRYRVKDVIPYHPDRKDKKRYFAVPTVLDGELSPYFCPTPKRGWNSGLALNLTEVDENAYCEMLHRFIEYKPEFLYSAGWITRPPGKALGKARKIHLALYWTILKTGHKGGS